jgi:Cys-tRNA(Pro)/Cys-tRNA(Cys) deacylase
MAIVNNVTRLLDAKKINYQAYETRAEKLGAIETATILGLDPFQVFKTIVVARQKPGKKILAVVPGPVTVDLKKVAAAVDEKKVVLVTEREAEQATGLQAGGISPLALINKGFQVIIDESALNFAQINISGGQRGLSIAMSAEDLKKITSAMIADISDLG